MKQALKELIENSPRRDCGKYSEFLVVPTSKAYNGFWGRNGYNDMIVLGYDKDEKKWYRLDIESGSDDFTMGSIYNAKIDVPREYGCVRVYFSEPLSVYHPMSSIMAYGKRGMR